MDFSKGTLFICILAAIGLSGIFALAQEETPKQVVKSVEKDWGNFVYDDFRVLITTLKPLTRPEAGAIGFEISTAQNSKQATAKATDGAKKVVSQLLLIDNAYWVQLSTWQFILQKAPEPRLKWPEDLETQIDSIMMGWWKASIK